MSEKIHDVAIIGAGVVGTAAARLLLCYIFHTMEMIRGAKPISKTCCEGLAFRVIYDYLKSMSSSHVTYSFPILLSSSQAWRWWRSPSTA